MTLVDGGGVAIFNVAVDRTHSEVVMFIVIGIDCANVNFCWKKNCFAVVVDVVLLFLLNLKTYKLVNEEVDSSMMVVSSCEKLFYHLGKSSELTDSTISYLF
ncbi:hypothetical protein ACTFIU_005502 [Dictyostelium citrinum]